MFKKTLAAAAVVSVLAVTGAQGAPAQSTYTLQIGGYVPVICRAQLNSTIDPSSAGQVSLGQMSEFCNNAAGYEVWVDYSPTLAGDTLVVDGQNVLLDSSGSARIDTADHPNIATKSLSLDVPQDGVSGSVSIRVVTL